MLLINEKEYADYSQPTSVDMDRLNTDINHFLSTETHDVVIV